MTRTHLAEALWGDDSLRDPNGALRSYVYSLRKQVDFDNRLQTRSDGYAFLLRDGDELDLQQFHRLVQRAQNAQQAQDMAEAAYLLERALAVWTEPPLADLPSTPAMQPVVLELLERRRAAEDLLADVLLTLGRHRQLLPALLARTAAEPLRERRWEQLMLGLYQSGRQTEALDAYTRARAALAEACGIEPGPSLRQLQQRILSADPSLDTGSAAALTRKTEPSTPIAVPHQLPATSRHLVGRQDELAMLAEAASGNSVAVAAVCGPPGVGKSSLALRFARSAAADFPDGELYVDLAAFDPQRSPITCQEAVSDLLNSLGFSPRSIPAGAPAQAALYRSLLADRRMLVVADNALNTAQVRMLVPASPGSMLLVTSRNQLGGLVTLHDANLITLQVLSDDAARELLAKRLGAERLAAEPEAVDDLIASCSRLPLALALFAAHATAHPAASLGDLAAQMRVHGNCLDLLDGTEPAAGIRTAFSCSYAKLTAGAARMFRLLGAYGSSHITVAAAADLAKTPLASARQALAELSRSNLLVEQSAGGFHLHDLLRAYAAEQAVAEQEVAPPNAAYTRRRFSSTGQHRFDDTEHWSRSA